MTNEEIDNELNELAEELIKQLQNTSIEFVDLLAFNRRKNDLISKKYYG